MSHSDSPPAGATTERTPHQPAGRTDAEIQQPPATSNTPVSTRSPDPPEEGAEGHGVEAENLEGSAPEIVKPFDPTEISISTKTPTVDLVVKRLEHDEILLSPDFQRHPDIWDTTRQSRLIESLLLRIPLPVFYVAADEEGRWHVVDGLQRLHSIKKFVLDTKLKLRGMEYLSRFESLTYDRLPRNMQRRIDETQLAFHVIDAGTRPEVMFNIFKRLNTGGKPLTPQEIRHALNPGPARDFVNALAVSEDFLRATDHSVSPRRMADRECVLRFIAFYCQDLAVYGGHLDAFLVSAMKRLNSMDDSDKEELHQAFRRAMHLATVLFGNRAFRKPASRSGQRSVVNKPLFESLAVALAQIPKVSHDVLRKRRDVINRRYNELMEDRLFHDSISIGTQTTKQVNVRFARIRALIHGVLDD